MTIVIFISAGVLLVGLIVILQRRSSGSEPTSRDVEHIDPKAEGTHQARSPGADGGGISYYNGGE
jgi:hypothetical protein